MPTFVYVRRLVGVDGQRTGVAQLRAEEKEK